MSRRARFIHFFSFVALVANLFAPLVEVQASSIDTLLNRMNESTPELTYETGGNDEETNPGDNAPINTLDTTGSEHLEDPPLPVTTPVSPVDPTIDASCSDPSMRAKGVVLPETSGVHYTVSQPDEAGARTVTASLTDTSQFSWNTAGIDASRWIPVGDTYVFTVNPCPPIVDTSSDTGISGEMNAASEPSSLHVEYDSNASLSPGDSIDYRVIISSGIEVSEDFGLAGTVSQGTTLQSLAVAEIDTSSNQTPWSGDQYVCLIEDGTFSCEPGEGTFLPAGHTLEITFTVRVSTDIEPEACPDSVDFHVTGAWTGSPTTSASNSLVCPSSTPTSFPEVWLHEATCADALVRHQVVVGDDAVGMTLDDFRVEGSVVTSPIEVDAGSEVVITYVLDSGAGPWPAELSSTIPNVNWVIVDDTATLSFTVPEVTCDVIVAQETGFWAGDGISSNDTFRPGEELVIRIAVWNTGPVPVPNLTMTSQLHSDLGPFDDDTWTIIQNGEQADCNLSDTGLLTCEISSLGPLDPQAVTGVVDLYLQRIVPVDRSACGGYSNTANLFAGESETPIGTTTTSFEIDCYAGVSFMPMIGHVSDEGLISATEFGAGDSLAIGWIAGNQNPSPVYNVTMVTMLDSSLGPFDDGSWTIVQIGAMDCRFEPADDAPGYTAFICDIEEIGPFDPEQGGDPTLVMLQQTIPEINAACGEFTSTISMFLGVADPLFHSTETLPFTIECGASLDISVLRVNSDGSHDTVNAPVRPGEEISYHIEVANTGDESIPVVEYRSFTPAGTRGVVWSSPNPQQNCWPIPDSNHAAGCHLNDGEVLAPGATMRLDITVEVFDSPDAQVCADGIVAVAQITAWPGSSAGNVITSAPSVTDVNCAEADISLDKTLMSPADGNARFGDPVEFRVSLTNNDDFDDTATFVDTLPTALADLPWAVTPEGLCGDVIEGQVTCEDVPVPAGETVDISFQVTLLSEYDAAYCGEHTNSAVLNGSTNPQTASIEVRCFEGLSITKTADPVEVEPGDTITYTIETSNLTNTFTPVEFTDLLPEGVTYVGWEAYAYWHSDPSNFYMVGDNRYRCDYEDGVVSCGALISTTGILPGGTFAVEITVTVNEDHSCLTTLVNSVQGNWANSDGSSVASVATNVVCPEPDLSLEKSGPMTSGMPTSLELDATYTYNVTVVNAGVGTASDVTVIDEVPEPLTVESASVIDGDDCEIVGNDVACDIDAVSGNSDVVIEIEVRTPLATEITWDECVAGVTNVAYIDEENIESAPVHNPFSCDAGIEVVKTLASIDMAVAGPDDRVDAGDVITWDITVTNTGDVTLENVEIFDGLDAVDFGDAQLTGITLEPGAANAITIQGSYVIGQLDIGFGGIINCVDVEGSTQGQFAEWVWDYDCESTAIERIASVDLVKVGPEGVTPGGQIEYTLTLTNTGNLTALTTNITDALPGNVTGWSVVSQDVGLCFILFGTLSCNGVLLAPGDDASVTVRGNVIASPGVAVCDAGYENTALGSAVTVVGPAADLSDAALTELDCQPDLAIEKTGPASVVSPGEVLAFTITVTNDGTYPAYDLTLTDSLVDAGLAGLDWTDDNDACGISEGNLECEIAEIAAYDGEFSVTLTADVELNSLECGEHANAATLGGDDSQFAVETTATAAFEIACVPLWSVEKESAYSDGDENGELSLGDTVTYRITITNDGNELLDSLVLEDVFSGANNLTWTEPEAFDGETVPDVAFQGSVTLQATYEIAQGDVDAGAIENCAHVAPGGDDEEAPFDCALDVIPRHPGLAVTKEATEIRMNEVAPDGRVDAGDVITYSFTVENTGNTTLLDVTVNDPLDGLEWESDPTIGTMAPGEIVVLGASYEVPQAAIDAGAVENCADATAALPSTYLPPIEPVDDVIAEEYCISTELPQEPEIGITHLGELEPGEDGRMDDGDTIRYTVTVENTGNITLTNLEITDDAPITLLGFAATSVSLAPGETQMATFTLVVDQVMIDLGEVEHCVLVTADGPVVGAEIPEQVIAEEDCITTDIPQERAVVLDKSGSLGNGGIAYRFTVTNTGNVTLTDLVLNDPMTGLVWDGETIITSLAPDESVTLTATYAVTKADREAGTVRNCAEVSAGVSGPTAEDCVDITIPSTPDSVPVVTELPQTGHGSIAAPASVLWAAAMLGVVALGAGALGVRRPT